MAHVTVTARTHRVTRESDGHDLLVVEYLGNATNCSVSASST
jgi:hypothetical protein